MSVAKPGIYQMASDEYHSHTDVLSHTGAIKLLPPSCPAKYRHWADNPEEPNREFDIGRAAHDLILQGVDSVTICEFDNWRKREAQEQRDAAYDAGKNPLLPTQWQAVQDMAETLWRHPLASALLRGGKPEQALFWRDEDTGMPLRALVDFLAERDPADMYGVDYKSCRSAHPAAVERAVWEYRYMCQASWYLDGFDVMGLTSAEHTPFYFIMQEKVAPYVVTVATPKPEAIRAGRQLNRQAIETYRRCVATGHWGGYSDEVVPVGLPTYAEYQLDEMLETVDA